MKARILFSITLLVASPAPTKAQWNIENHLGNTRVTATGVAGLVQVALSCQDENQVSLTVTLLSGGSFRNGDLEVEWDDQPPKPYTLQNREGILSGSSGSPQADELIVWLRERDTVLLRAAIEPGDSVTARINLAGSFRAIGSLPCSSALRVSPPQLTDARIREILIRQSIANYWGSCPCPYNTDRAGRRCGRRSAYSRPGGASPLCYPRDVSDAAVEAYRRRSGDARGLGGVVGASIPWSPDGVTR